MAQQSNVSQTYGQPPHLPDFCLPQNPHIASGESINFLRSTELFVIVMRQFAIDLGAVRLSPEFSKRLQDMEYS